MQSAIETLHLYGGIIIFCEGLQKRPLLFGGAFDNRATPDLNTKPRFLQSHPKDPPILMTCTIGKGY